MRRRELLTGTAAATTALLAGCIGGAEEGGGDGTSSDARTITVSASGEAEADPDLAVVQVAVEARGEDAESVRDELAERADDLRGALLAYGLEEDQVTTGDFRIRERVDERAIEARDDEPRTEADVREHVYYEGTHGLTAEVEAVEDAGEVVDVAVDAGADDVDRVQFTLSEARRAELREEALEGAIADARSEADFVAGELDASVLEARRVDTSGGRLSPVRAEVADYAMEDDADPATDLHPDDVTVSASVDVEYLIE